MLNLPIDTTELLIVSLLGYLLGSIPFGLLMAQSAGLGDIRKTGSGNIGATNVLRSGGKGAAAITLLLDMAKAALAVTLVTLFAPPLYHTIEGYRIPHLYAYIAGFAALVGHMHPVWLNFKGGKGVASYFGILLSLSWQVFLIAAINWLLVFYLKRISSLAALFTACFVPLWLYIFTDMRGLYFGLSYSVLVIYKHRENIVRLVQGKEQPFGKSRKAAETA